MAWEWAEPGSAQGRADDGEKKEPGGLTVRGGQRVRGLRAMQAARWSLTMPQACMVA